MRKTILTILGSAALAASFVQVAAATERHHVRRAQRAPVTQQTYRDTNAWVDPYAQPNWGYAQPNWSRYEGGAISAPAGH